MNPLLILPVLLPLLGAAVSVLIRYRPRARRGMAIGIHAALLALALRLLHQAVRDGVQVLRIGDWPAPFGIVFVVDIFSAVMLVLSGLVGLAVAVYAIVAVDNARERFGYHTFTLVLLMGVNGAFITGDLFNLYVWFEVMLMASFVLLALGGERPQLEGAIKYVALNFIASSFFLAAVGLLYGMTGTLNMADLAVKLRDAPSEQMVTVVAMLFMTAFGIKAAMFPLFFWLPASYHTPPAPVSAIFAGLLTKVGVYALVRMFTLVFTQDTAFTHGLLLGAAAFSMVTGVLGAAAQSEFRRILAFHSVSQIGYMVLGLGLQTRLALAGTVLFIVHHAIVKTNLFLIAGLMRRLQGSYMLARLGGGYRGTPFVAALFLVTAMSLAGLPPLSGFAAKLTLLVAAAQSGRYLLVAVALGVGLLTLYSMTKIWNQVFWEPSPTGVAAPALARLSPAECRRWIGPIAVFAALAVAIGLAAGPLLALALRAADQLLDPAAYITAVLGAGEGGVPP